MRSPTPTRLLRLLRPLAVLVAVAALAACGDDSDDSGVASLETGADAAGASASPTGDAEEELLAYAQCLRDQGLDVPDPEVDADGNLVLGGGGGGAGGGDGQPPDPEEFEAAQEVCGEPPAGVGGALDELQSPEFQDALLAFTQCLRDRGYDVEDIQPGDGPGGGGGGAGGGGPLGDLDVDDPEVAADLDECQSEAFAGVDLPGAGGQG
ncbi:MAG: hypothetical protein ACFCVG_14710 [Kineosporiaceae bacterium]